MKKITLIICMICAGICFAQVHIGKFSNPDSKWTYGGYTGVGGVFGNNSETSIYIAPRVGYLVDSNLEAGLSGSLNWFSSKYYNASTLGVGPYANYYIGRNFFINGLFQEYFINYKNKSNDAKTNYNEPALYFGAGYMQRIGNKAYIQIGGMYNVLYSKDKNHLGGAFVPNIGIVFGI